MGSKNPWVHWAQIFLVIGVHNVIMPFKFDDDRFRGFWLAEGQSLPFPIDFEGRPYNTHTTVWGVMWNFALKSQAVAQKMANNYRQDDSFCRTVYRLQRKDVVCVEDWTHPWTGAAKRCRPALHGQSKNVKLNELITSFFTLGHFVVFNCLKAEEVILKKEHKFLVKYASLDNFICYVCHKFANVQLVRPTLQS